MIRIDAYNENLKKLYLNSRNNLIKILADESMSQAKKQYSKTLLLQVNKELRTLRKNSDNWISLICPKEYSKGVRITNKYFRDNNIEKTIDSAFAAIHKDAVNILAREMSYNINQGISQVGRRIRSYYDEIGRASCRERV